MAWLEKDPRTGNFKIGIHLAEGKLKRSLKTVNRSEAEGILGVVENTIMAIERGWIEIPDDIDLGEFLISGGKAAVKQNLQRQLRMAELFQRYFSSLPADSASFTARPRSLEMVETRSTAASKSFLSTISSLSLFCGMTRP